MDHLSFIFSLLLIVSVTTTTFGSAIKTNNPNGEREIKEMLAHAGLKDSFPEMTPNRKELEAHLKRFRETAEDFYQDSENFDLGVSPGTIISAAQLTIPLLEKLLKVLQDVERKCAVGVNNTSGLGWRQGSTFFFSGTADENLPFDVNDGYAVLYGPRKTTGPVATGVVGVLAYFIPEIDKTLAVMFSVPFDYNWYQNWWNAKLYSGNERAKYELYYDLYYNANPFGPDGWHVRSLGSGLIVHGSMSNNGIAVLEINVLKE